jgi:predicted RNA-binding protein with PIN domain
MIKKYIIDGNNLIGKINFLWKLQQTDKAASRSKLAFMLERYFSTKKHSVSLHFDGHRSVGIRTSRIKITYSEDKSADEWIRTEITNEKNPKVVAVVSSDQFVLEFARVNRCKPIKSESFARELLRNRGGDEEKDRIKDIDDDEIKRAFGVE